MSNPMSILLLALLVALAVVFVVSYNSLVRSRNMVQNGWNQIDVQLKRRRDLIPNLVETVKGYIKHEQQTLENVTKARNLAVQAQGRTGQIAAEGALGAALAHLFAITENYPELKANQDFMAMLEELTSTENRIAFSRQFYNDSVMEYNNARQGFPTLFTAALCNFSEEPYWKIAEAEERIAPRVGFPS
jgi:LemA protein